MLKNTIAIWEKISNLLKKGFDSEPVYDNVYIKSKIKIYDGKVNTYFDDNKIPEDNTCHTCLSAILLDPVVRIDNDYPQIFLEECKYAVKKKKNSVNEN